jgi:transcriptional regulator with XRE-family HTH domain
MAMMIDMQQLGARVRQARKHLRLRQGKLAEQAGIDAGNLSELEHGRKPSARIETLASLADVLQVSTDYLLGFTDDPRPHWQRQEML